MTGTMEVVTIFDKKGAGDSDDMKYRAIVITGGLGGEWYSEEGDTDIRLWDGALKSNGVSPNSTGGNKNKKLDWRSLDEDLDTVLVREEVTALQGVVGVQVEVVVVARDAGRASLGRHGVASHRVELETQATETAGRPSTAAIAARNPAPPPPTRTMSCRLTSTRSLVRAKVRFAAALYRISPARAPRAFPQNCPEAAMARLEFFFDCSSPWTYLAFHRVEDVPRDGRRSGVAAHPGGRRVQRGERQRVRAAGEAGARQGALLREGFSATGRAPTDCASVNRRSSR
jgi:hypothetical protein